MCDRESCGARILRARLPSRPELPERRLPRARKRILAAATSAESRLSLLREGWPARPKEQHRPTGHGQAYSCQPWNGQRRWAERTPVVVSMGSGSTSGRGGEIGGGRGKLSPGSWRRRRTLAAGMPKRAV